MKLTGFLVLAIFAAVLYCSDAYPQGSVGFSGSDMSGKVLLHTTGIEEGHQHTASCFGSGRQGQGQSSAPPATTAAST